MGWALVQRTKPHHPVGAKVRPLTTIFVLWIFDSEEEATTYRDTTVREEFRKNYFVVQTSDKTWNVEKRGEEKSDPQ